MTTNEERPNPVRIHTPSGIFEGLLLGAESYKEFPEVDQLLRAMHSAEPEVIVLVEASVGGATNQVVVIARKDIQAASASGKQAYTGPIFINGKPVSYER